MKRNILKISVALLAVCLCIAASAFSLLAADSFEKEISAFPESYKVYLRDLHKKYPNWHFTCENTGLDWYAAVEAENSAPAALSTKSAITKDASSLLKDKSKGFYDSSTGKYTTVDAGFVRASKSAVAYYMDPRNFLNEKDVFQFELLSFSDVIKTGDVDRVLSGTFMYNTKINYYNSEGKLKKTSETYAECIYNAGKKYNINPCFLASRIRGEVVSGTGPSGSVSGKYSGYEGYYNFYNIGAYSDATSPIKNGLKYAKTSGSYGRPWDSPSKAINGGAQFLAESYIAKGQDTGYYQKFNVYPNDKTRTYEHQYMSNVSAPVSQSNSTYNSYSSNNLMTMARTFSIPVFKNMPGADKQAKDFSLFDTPKNVKATTTLNVREKPDINGSFIVSVKPETEITAISKCRNTSGSSYQMLYYPYWYQITFTQDGKKYTGYAVADYLTPASTVNVNKGASFTLPRKSTGSEEPTLYTWDTSVISIGTDGKTIKALKNGTAYVTAITSAGGYDYIKINVGSYSNSSLAVKNFKVTSSETGTLFSWSKVSGASGYELSVLSGNNTVYTKNISSSSSSVTVTTLTSDGKYSAKIRAYKLSSTSKLNGEFSSINEFTVMPKQVTGLFCEKVSVSSFTLSWNAVDDADGYEIMKFNKTSGKYEALKKINDTSLTFSAQSAGQSNLYKVRAYVQNGSSYAYGNPSKEVEGYTYKQTMKKPTKMSLKKTQVTVTLPSVSSANKYYFYKYDSSQGKYVECGESDKNQYTFSSLTTGYSYNVMVEAVNVNSDGAQKIAGLEFVINALPKKVGGLKEISSTGYKAEISWTASKGAVGYQIYVLNASKNDYELIGETKENSYTLSGFSPCTSKSVKVCAYTENIGKKNCGDFSSAINAYSGPKKPTGLKATGIMPDSVSIKWTKKSGADCYYVYSVDAKTGELKLLSTVTDTSYTVKSLKPGKTYKFKVATVSTVGKTKFRGSLSSALKVKTAPDKISGISSEKHSKTGYTLKWNEASSADGYYVYRYDSKKKQYNIIADTEETLYKVKSLYSAKKDKYKIAGYVTVSGKKYAGKLSDEYYVSTIAKNPTKLTAVRNKDGSISLTWKKVDRATGYAVYIHNGKTGNWKKLGKTTNLKYVISSSHMTSDYDGEIKVKTYVTTGTSRYSSGAKVKISTK